MRREEYRSCIGREMRGRKLTRPERKLAFCAASKLCSGKAKTREEAVQVCLRIHPELKGARR